MYLPPFCSQIENVVRDSCDAGAFETWGIGSGNTYHTNSISDCDSGGVDGSWMNFMFQDDASVRRAEKEHRAAKRCIWCDLYLAAHLSPACSTT
jgi:hypothetical protein